MEGAHEAKEVSNINFGCHVLMMSHWPTSTEGKNVHLPDDVKQLYKIFNNFYLNEPGNKKRKLVWQHNMSRAVLRAKYANVSIPQSQD